MRFTDSQVHIWGANTPEHPWTPFAVERHGDRVFSVDDLITALDEVGVQRAVIATPAWFGGNSVSLQAAADYPDRFGVMGTFDLFGGDLDELRTWRDQPGMLGLRIHFSDDQLGLIETGACDPYWKVMEQAGVPLMLAAAGRTALVLDIARRFPDLRLLLDHMNLALDVRDGDIGPALDAVAPLAEAPNVAIKFSEMQGYSTEGFPYAVLHEPIKRIIDTFGVERCMWGSGYTGARWPYPESVRLFTEGLDFLSASDKETILGGAASRWLGWPDRRE